MTCDTCPRALTATEQAKGIHRCLSCRRAHPGRVLSGRPRAHKQADPGYLFPKVQKATAAAPTLNGISWWVGKSRAELNAAALKLFPGSEPRLSLNHGHRFGEQAS